MQHPRQRDDVPSVARDRRPHRASSLEGSAKRERVAVLLIVDKVPMERVRMPFRAAGGLQSFGFSGTLSSARRSLGRFNFIREVQ